MLLYSLIQFKNKQVIILNILITGCGQLASQLANNLDKQNHDIAIIGPKQHLQNNLSEDFSGFLVPGDPIDADTLKSAGAENCECVICATESDNKNIMTAQIIKHIFQIENIIVRILDPVKCDIYKQIGFTTISPTLLAFDSIYAKIFKTYENKTLEFGKSSLKIKILKYEKWMKNKTFTDVEYVNENKLIGFLNENDELKIFSRQNNREIKKTDKLIYAKIF